MSWLALTQQPTCSRSHCFVTLLTVVQQPAQLNAHASSLQCLQWAKQSSVLPCRHHVSTLECPAQATHLLNTNIINYWAAAPPLQNHANAKSRIHAAPHLSCPVFTLSLAFRCCCKPAAPPRNFSCAPGCCTCLQQHHWRGGAVNNEAREQGAGRTSKARNAKQGRAGQGSAGGR